MQSDWSEYRYKLQLIGVGMQYVKAGKQILLARLLQQLSVMSTAPALRYPLPVEQLSLPSIQASALSPSGSPLTSSITVLSPARAYALAVPNRIGE
jgi:hypothetical protein